MKDQINLSPAPSFVISNDVEQLEDIQRADINISIWERPVNPEMNQWLEQFKESDFKSFNLHTTSQTFKGDFENALINYQNSSPLGFQSLLEDADMLLQAFAKITQKTNFRIYWAIVRNGMCRRFHTDANTLRLLCTYMGPGTQWVKPDNIDYDIPHCKGNEMIINEDEIQQTKPFDVVILKGALHAERDTPPILHRSPPIESETEKRILFRIDVLEEE